MGVLLSQRGHRAFECLPNSMVAVRFLSSVSVWSIQHHRLEAPSCLFCPLDFADTICPSSFAPSFTGCSFSICSASHLLSCPAHKCGCVPGLYPRAHFFSNHCSHVTLSSPRFLASACQRPPTDSSGADPSPKTSLPRTSGLCGVSHMRCLPALMDRHPRIKRPSPVPPPMSSILVHSVTEQRSGPHLRFLSVL